MHPSAHLATVSAHYALAVAGAAPGPEERPEAFRRPTAHGRLPYPEVRRLWDRALGPDATPGTGLRLGSGLLPQALHVLGHIVLTSRSLGEAAEAAIRYHPLVSEAGAVTMSHGSGLSHLVYRPTVEADTMHPQQVEAVLAAAVAAARWLAGSSWAPLKVSFAHPRIGGGDQYEEAFRCPVRFEAPDNSVTLPTGDLDRTYAASDPELAALHRGYADRLLAELASPVAAAERARHWLAHAPLAGIVSGDLRDALHMSDRGLRRALQEHGTSWRVLLDEARHARARHLLETTDFTTDRVAHAVGLSGAAALGHAFSRWQGTSPGAYRRAHRRDP